MAVRVLVVDDSRFFRRRVTEILDADPALEVVGTAENGVDAVEKVKALRPDVVTMDIEMPVMDGITAVRRIMSARPTPVLMFSSLTTEGAKATLDALEAGAVDFLPKRFEDISKDRNEAKNVLCKRVRLIAMEGLGRSTAKSRPATPQPVHRVQEKAVPVTGESPRSGPRHFKVSKFKIVAIGTSTGGPVALQEVLSKLPADFPLPLLLVQHMPATFTTAFANRLDHMCKITVKEAEDGDLLKPATALLAPGGRQMIVEGRNGHTVVRIGDAQPGQTYKPSVDVTFSSLAKVYGGHVLAVVLTGMGADGRQGAQMLKQCGATVWAQNKETCVVYGMPGAVAEAGVVDQTLALPDIGVQLAQGV